MKSALLLVLLALLVSSAGMLEDLQEMGIPAISVELTDSLVVVGLEGSLAEGDSLLKHYGGIFFSVVDSISAGWEVSGIDVRLEEADLIFRRCDMLLMLDEFSQTARNEEIANWVLSHTRVFRR